MATLHMDVDACRSVRSSLDSNRQQLVQEVNAVTSQVRSMVGATWIAPGADNFQNEIEDWSKGMEQYLENLENLAKRLDNEIVEWENAARN
ncbi:MAG: WXG100 family type VII secretion target [Chloroflexi bacterium]|jgi:WXG100 family type VII secretion target|nr:WXG100 family type VII secretion target [Anaerolineaceae bacterium]NMB88715.1 WXG100 family type VII secretion target [Chloroflexota bacterium]